MRFAVTIFFLATSAVAHAQTSPHAPDAVILTPLTLEEALRAAEAVSPSLQKARAELQALEAEIAARRKEVSPTSPPAEEPKAPSGPPLTDTGGAENP